ncbi:LysB family transcriptional regulator [Pseudomonas plecoglossicida]|nr:phage lysis regulatory protein, LysB family [Pseudomonas putida HB3267]PLU99142.1 LysB family transcriptional regulator [Pseudomonas plecoglossicida]PLV11130.1 LysB family transcriptional regulator [Pseudomonas plecoglossicida]
MDLRDGLLAGALFAAVSAGLWGWGQQLLLGTEKAKTTGLERQLTTAQVDASRNLATATKLKSILERERADQAQLLKVQVELRQGLAARQRTIEALKHENDQLRDWARQLLPDAARRLRERPALTGADAYRQWLSGGGPVRPAGDSAEGQRGPSQ